MLFEEVLAGAFVVGLTLLAGKAIHDDPDGVKERFTNGINNMWTCPGCGRTNTRYLCQCGNWKCQNPKCDCREINPPRISYCKKCNMRKGER